MPILGQHDMTEALNEAIDDGHHGIAIGNSKLAAGAEIVLHVDYQQQIIVAGPDLHLGPVLEVVSKLSKFEGRSPIGSVARRSKTPHHFTSGINHFATSAVDATCVPR